MSFSQNPARRPFFRRRKTCPFSGANAPVIDYKELSPLFALAGGSVVVLMVGLFRSPVIRQVLVPVLTAVALLTAIGLSIWIWEPGVRKPIVDFSRLAFAIGTPYETVLGAHVAIPERVMAPEVAETIRQASVGVVKRGTAKGLQGAYLDADGQMTNVGGKTGTGDNRFDTFARGGGLISARPVDRTATFAFFLSDRFYGTITAYVAGRQAGQYSFTSALAVQVLKVLEPALRPLIGLPEAQEPRPLGLRIEAEDR